MLIHDVVTLKNTLRRMCYLTHFHIHAIFLRSSLAIIQGLVILDTTKPLKSIS